MVEGVKEAGDRAATGAFPSSSLRRARIRLHLQRDLGVNLTGAALALDLLERIEELRARLLAIRGEVNRSYRLSCCTFRLK